MSYRKSRNIRIKMKSLARRDIQSTTWDRAHKTSDTGSIISLTFFHWGDQFLRLGRPLLLLATGASRAGAFASFAMICKAVEREWRDTTYVHAHHTVSVQRIVTN